MAGRHRLEIEGMKFTKLQATGNDFVLIEAVGMRRDWPKLSRAMCDRRFGVGSDGLILLLPSRKADFRMRMFNPDGSEAVVCGNGLRCVGRYAVAEGLAAGPDLVVETAVGERAAVRPQWSLAPFDRRFRLYLAAVLVFSLGNSSDAFLLVRASELGVATPLLPLLWCAFHIVKSAGNLLAGRSVLVRKLRMTPVECVARGYLAGSGWQEYRASGTVCVSR